jgi:F0F1-type ATP synthase membrane subunit b/b'
VDALLRQLGLDHTFFIEIGIIFFFSVFLSRVYFQPFLKLFEIRHSRMVKDRETAELLRVQTQEKWDQYYGILSSEKRNAKKDYEAALLEAREEEARVMALAEEEAKKFMQDAVESVDRQRKQLQKVLEKDVPVLAQHVLDGWISRNT